MSTQQQRDDAEKNVLRVMLALPGCRPGVTLRDVARDADVSERTAWRILKRLVGRGTARRYRDRRVMYYHLSPRNGGTHQ